MAFTLTVTLPDEKLEKLVEKGKVKISSDNIRKYILSLVDKDLLEETVK